jgi:hypothetical protein
MAVGGFGSPNFDSVSSILDKIQTGQSALDIAQSVPTSDTKLEAKETGIKIFGISIGISWNQLAINITKTVLNQVIDSTVKWANTGFNGNPAFVTNPSTYFGELANGIAGDFIKNTSVGFLCSPLQSQINVNFKVSLQQYYDQPYRPQCTLTGIKGNVENFYDHFSSGGWKSFIQLTQNSSNNPYGSYIQAEIQLDKKVATALGSEKTKIDWGQGFKSQGDCVQYNASESEILDYENGVDNAVAKGTQVYREDIAPGACVKYGPDKTPGTLIKEHIDKALPANSFLSEVTNADQFDKLLTALANGFLRKFVFSSGGLLGGGSGGSNSGTSGGTSIPPVIECTPSPDTGVMGITKINWSVSNNFQDKAVSFTWSGDDGLTGTGDSVNHTYQNVFGTMKASVTASTTNLDDLGNYIPGTENRDQVFACTPVKINQFPPLHLNSCTPSSLTTKADQTVTWTAIVSGGSGKLTGMQWSGGQTDYPGCNQDLCTIWGFPSFIPNVPFYPADVFSAPGKKVGTTIYTTTVNSDKTTTITAARVYVGDTGGHKGAKPGDTNDASFKLYDADPNVLPLNADCGSITIVP